MVHALEGARKHLVPGGVLICIQPNRLKRPFIAITAPGLRQPVCALINPPFQPLITAAEAAIRAAVGERRLALIGTTHHQFRVGLTSLAELRRYLSGAVRPPRFPPGGRQRFRAQWRTRPAGAQIEVTEFMTIFAMRA